MLESVSTEIPLSNFRGIEIREFPSEIARLSLIIAEFQCDVLYRGQKDAIKDFLPLDNKNWIVCGNALQLDWLSICPPTGTVVKHVAEDLFHTPLDQHEIDFENEGGETFICGNPPYLGSKKQTDEQKSDLRAICEEKTTQWRLLDYVAGWFLKSADYGQRTPTTSAFVSTNSISQGQQVPILWPLLFNAGFQIVFAHNSFKWSNLASHNAGVTVVIVGLSNIKRTKKSLITMNKENQQVEQICENISAYLTNGPSTFVLQKTSHLSGLNEMFRGNSPTDGGNLIIQNRNELNVLTRDMVAKKFVKRFVGSKELIDGVPRHCIWIEDDQVGDAEQSPALLDRIEKVKVSRLSSSKRATQDAAQWPHRFDERKPIPKKPIIVVPRITSENRPYLPVNLIEPNTVISNSAFMLDASDLWHLSLIASRINACWVGAVCARLEMRFSYTNTNGWNTFPVPKLTEKNKLDLTRCATEILLAREAHFPATIADLYDSEDMPENLRAAHDRNDEVLERIYIGRRFKNDTERLEKLFELYTKMTAASAAHERIS